MALTIGIDLCSGFTRCKYQIRGMREGQGLPFGASEQISNATVECIRKVRSGGGHILTCSTTIHSAVEELETTWQAVDSSVVGGQGADQT
jgi:hypothetical protein